MNIGLTIKNYRCFAASQATTFWINKGFHSFVGVNNSGKSSLLKFFFELRPTFQALALGDVNLQQLYAAGQVGLPPVPHVQDRDEIFWNGNREDIEITILVADIPETTPQIVTRAILTISRSDSSFRAKFFTASGMQVTSQMWPQNAGSARWVENALYDGRNNVFANFGQLLAASRKLANMLYIPMFRHIDPLVPAQGAPSTYYDINVGRNFIDMWHALQSGSSSKEGRERIHDLVGEIREIFGFRQLQITTAADRNSLQLMIGRKTFELRELGAGLVQFIVVLGNAAFKKPSFILVDEPETSLHPSLQVKFLTKLSTYASEGVIFVTHNLGLARAVSDEIYSVVQSAEGSTLAKLPDTPRLSELLGELNYEGYRPLGFDKLLLVEGRTGVKTYLQFLRILGRDHEFLLVPLADMINRYSREELQEVTRICPKTFAIVDSERNVQNGELGPGREPFADNCRDLGIECLVLERRAMENYLTEDAIKLTQGNHYRALGPFEDRKGIPLWPKTENWRVVTAMNRRDFEDTDLGRFLIRIR